MSHHAYSLSYLTAVRYVNFGDEPLFKRSNWTWGFWARQGSDLPAAGQYFLGDGSLHYSIRSANTRQLDVRYKNAAGAGKSVIGAIGDVFYQKWSFFGFTCYVNGSDVRVTISVNGRLVQDTTNSDGWFNTYGTTWQLGSYLNGAQFLGLHSGAFFVDHALTLEELGAIGRYEVRPQDLTGILGFWPMDEGVGTDVIDVISAVNGTCNADQWRRDVPTRARRQ